MRIIVCHAYYGCDTGCCGHAIEVDDERVEWSFEHPNSKDDLIAWAKTMLVKKFGEKHLQDVDWENCVICEFSKCSF